MKTLLSLENPAERLDKSESKRRKLRPKVDTIRNEGSLETGSHSLGSTKTPERREETN